MRVKRKRSSGVQKQKGKAKSIIPQIREWRSRRAVVWRSSFTLWSWWTSRTTFLGLSLRWTHPSPTRRQQHPTMALKGLKRRRLLPPPFRLPGSSAALSGSRGVAPSRSSTASSSFTILRHTPSNVVSSRRNKSSVGYHHSFGQFRYLFRVSVNR